MNRFLAIFASFLSLSLIAQSPVSIDYSDLKRPIFKVYVGNNDQTVDSLMRLYVHKIDNTSNPFPVVGIYKQNGDTLSFQSKFDLSNSVKFQIHLKDTIVPFQLIDQTENHPVTITRSYPKTGKIPSNILTFYIEFSKPMKYDPSAYKYVDVIRQNGDIVELPWRQRSYWINNNKTLVLMIHPGRVKKGIHSTYNLEPIFIPNEEVFLKIKRGMVSADGNKIIEPITLAYTVIEKDLIAPKFMDKSISVPQENSTEALKITFSEPMDYGLIYKWFRIEYDQITIDGELYSDNGKTWFFTPSKPWKKGFYSIQLSNQLGDLCHNQTDRLFEVATITDINKRFYQTVSFTVK